MVLCYMCRAVQPCTLDFSLARIYAFSLPMLTFCDSVYSLNLLEDGLSKPVKGANVFCEKNLFINFLQNINCNNSFFTLKNILLTCKNQKSYQLACAAHVIIYIFYHYLIFQSY